MVELQEPADLSIMLEWSTFSLAAGEATLGLPLDEALACIDRRACPPERLQDLHGRPLNTGIGSLLPDEADAFFVAERVDTQGCRTCHRATACSWSPPAATWPPRTGRPC